MQTSILFSRLRRTSQPQSITSDDDIVRLYQQMDKLSLNTQNQQKLIETLKTKIDELEDKNKQLEQTVNLEQKKKLLSRPTSKIPLAKLEVPPELQLTSTPQLRSGLYQYQQVNPVLASQVGQPNMQQTSFSNNLNNFQPQMQQMPLSKNPSQQNLNQYPQYPPQYDYQAQPYQQQLLQQFQPNQYQQQPQQPLYQQPQHAHPTAPLRSKNPIPPPPQQQNQNTFQNPYTKPKSTRPRDPESPYPALNEQPPVPVKKTKKINKKVTSSIIQSEDEDGVPVFKAKVNVGGMQKVGGVLVEKIKLM
ncbi:Hypothetical_protein [Hexamita inflata]|uniref:Hypothetical_protein n=1 Tax=Hexamita inflata TaxID=28002 RepID=A0AA86PXK1_9EUKA|nr:Hypothetical protein HINF_LOCUS30820 [Hexamita inflata]